MKTRRTDYPPDRSPSWLVIWSLPVAAVLVAVLLAIVAYRVEAARADLLWTDYAGIESRVHRIWVDAPVQAGDTVVVWRGRVVRALMCGPAVQQVERAR